MELDHWRMPRKAEFYRFLMVSDSMYGKTVEERVCLSTVACAIRRCFRSGDFSQIAQS
jgi:hypothetical protein